MADDELALEFHISKFFQGHHLVEVSIPAVFLNANLSVSTL